MEWPKCEVCLGEGVITDDGPDPETGEFIFPKCPSCHGTGEKAELTEAEAIRYLVESYVSVKIKPYHNPKGIPSIIACTLYGEFNGPIKEAINAAARAVKERNA